MSTFAQDSQTSDALTLDRRSWAELRRLLDAALELPPSGHAAWIDGLGPEHAGLKPLLAACLLQTSPRPSPIDVRPKAWNAALAGLDAHADGPAGATPPGARSDPVSAVGPYRLLRPLGTGGMGAVWLAERDDLLSGRVVALKLPRSGRHSARFAERLTRECEILAKLCHPHVARLYDAGVTEGGQAYLALEYVEGEPIDTFCSSRKLGVRDVLGLFLQAARAVAHAHANLVVHRDLKPGNVLVSAAAEVKLLDFGIAKLIDDGIGAAAALTQEGERVLTPEYAAPEQVANRPVGIATDIYALGVLLYRLLTTQRPYRLAHDSRPALEEAILRDEPLRPSDAVNDRRLARELRGDLDAIVLKALKKEPGDRYASVDAFAEDVERWLQGRPVCAHAGGWWYRLRKGLSRNRLLASAGAFAAAAMLLGTGIALWQAHVARTHGRHAVEVKEFVTSILQQSDPYAHASGRPTTVMQMLDEARARLDGGLVAQPLVRSELRLVIGRAYLGLREAEKAQQTFSNAMRETRGMVGDEHPLRVHLALGLARAEHGLGRDGEAEAIASGVLKLLAAAGDADRLELARAHGILASIALGRQDAGLAVDHGRKALANAAAAGSPSDVSDDTRAWARSILSSANAQLGRPQVAELHARVAYTLYQQRHASNADHPDVTLARANWGLALFDIGRTNKGAAELEQAVMRALRTSDPQDGALVGLLDMHARIQIESGELEPGIHSLRKAVSIAPPGSRRHRAVSSHLAWALLAARRADEALAALPQDLSQGLAAADDEHLWLGRACRALASAYQGDLRAAEAELLSVHAQQQAAGSRYAFRPLVYLGIVRLMQRRAADAQPSFADAAAALRREKGYSYSRYLALALSGQAAALLDQGDDAAALPLLLEAGIVLARVETRITPLTADLQLLLARSALRANRPDDALRHANDADAFWRSHDPASRSAGEAAFWVGQSHRASGNAPAANAALARAARILATSPLPYDTQLARRARAG